MSDEKVIQQICADFNVADAKFENGKLWLKDFPIAEWRETEFTEHLKIALMELPSVANDPKPVFKLEVGKSYFDRKSRVEHIVRFVEGLVHPFVAISGRAYTEGGFYRCEATTCYEDLVTVVQGLRMEDFIRKSDAIAIIEMLQHQAKPLVQQGAASQVNQFTVICEDAIRRITAGRGPHHE